MVCAMIGVPTARRKMREVRIRGLIQRSYVLFLRVADERLSTKCLRYSTSENGCSGLVVRSSRNTRRTRCGEKSAPRGRRLG